MLVPMLAAIRSYKHQVVPVRLNIADGAGVLLPPDRAEAIAGLAGELEAEGFVPVSDVGPAEPGGMVYARVLVHRGDATTAWAVDGGREAGTVGYVELLTEWEDGTVVSTVNHGRPQIFESLPRLRQVRLSGVSVATAVARHREACAEIAGRRLDPAERDAVEVAQEQNAEVLAHQERCGILRRRGEDYGFTLRGAWRSTLRIHRAMQAS